MHQASRVLPFARRVAEQLARVGVLDNATRLAAQAFLTALPMLIVIATYSPEVIRAQLLMSLRSLFGAPDAVMRQVEGVYRGAPGARGTWGAVGVLVTIVSATAFVRALQRLCERSWQLPHAGMRIAVWRWFVWLVVWTTGLVCQGMLRTGFGVGLVLAVPLQVAVAVLVWWWTQHLLLAGRIGWRPLFPGAVVTGGAVVAFTGASGLWLPHSLEVSVQRYGSLGSVFTLLSWLILFFTTVVLGIAVGCVLAQERPLSRAADGHPGRNGHTRRR